MKKDDYLMNMIEIPPKQRLPIHQFDLRTQRDAFSVSLEGLKGVCSVPLTYSQSHLLTFISVIVEYQCTRSRITTSSRRQETKGAHRSPHTAY